MQEQAPESSVLEGLRIVRLFLAAEIERMKAAGIPVGEDDYRGLYVAGAEAERIVGSWDGPAGPAPTATALRQGLERFHAEASGRIALLRDLATCTAFDLGCLLLCLLAESDLESERLIAYVQDDVSKRRPRVDLALRMFGPAGRRRFEAAAPLLRLRLIRLHDEPGQPFTPLVARYLSLDERVAEFLLGGDEPTAALRPVAALPTPAGPLPGTPGWEEVGHTAALPAAERPPVVSLAGHDVDLVRLAAQALSAPVPGLLEVTFPPLKAQEGLDGAFLLAAREAKLLGRTLLLTGLDPLTPDESEQLVRVIEREPWARPLVLSSLDGFRWPGVCLTVPELDYEQRRARWDISLVDAGLAVDTAAIDTTAGRFQLGTSAIAHAALRAGGIGVGRGRRNGSVELEDLLAGARSQSTPILSGLATKVIPHYVWEDIVLAADTLTQLQEIRGQVEHRHVVYDSWGFGKKLATGKGLVALFAGQSGTGKTMAADVLANTLGLDLYRIDLSAVVSKYIGETEKNLASLFTEAQTSNAILFFDEADALFGKRSEVKDAHDRYANIETAYLLQRIEAYDGMVILATNLKMNLDDAFLRRLQFVVDFPMPEEPQRRRIWQGSVANGAPLADDVDWDFLARQFRVSGGNIRNAVLAGAFLAADDAAAIGTIHFVRGMRREYQKLGRMISDAEFGPYSDQLRGR